MEVLEMNVNTWCFLTLDMFIKIVTADNKKRTKGELSS